MWSHTNILYMQNFLHFMCTVDPYSVCFVDEASVNQSTASHYYSTAESGSRALDISSYKKGENYTIFRLVSLNNRYFVQVDPVQTGGNNFINFIHEAMNARNNTGEPILPNRSIILSNCASVHSSFVQAVLKLYLDQFNIRYYFIPAKA